MSILTLKCFFPLCIGDITVSQVLSRIAFNLGCDCKCGIFGCLLGQYSKQLVAFKGGVNVLGDRHISICYCRCSHICVWFSSTLQAVDTIYRLVLAW